MAGIVGTLSLCRGPDHAILEPVTKRPARREAQRPEAMRPRTLRVAMLAYPDVQVLDVMGPLEVFSRTSRWLKDHGRRSDDAYTVEIIGVKRGAFETSSNLRLFATHGFREVGRGLDTLLISGGKGVKRFASKRPLVAWVRRQAGWVRRLASVCNGTFFLAEAGLLDGRRATTHWGSCEELARAYPAIRVEPDTIYIREGSIYTSAGVTAGMDLALALVEEDYGREVALAVARELVLFLRRPGGQAQFSAQLAVQFAEHEPLRDLQAWIIEHPRADLSVEALARRVAMSARNFARVFSREVGTSPARFVTSVRVETARRLLEETSDDLTSVCSASGLGTTESMRRAFLRTVGVSPGQYRERFSAHRDGDRRPRGSVPRTAHRGVAG
jgi:transcriptional regulator GlxA family with amidase domain